MAKFVVTGRLVLAVAFEMESDGLVQAVMELDGLTPEQLLDDLDRYVAEADSSAARFTPTAITPADVESAPAPKKKGKKKGGRKPATPQKGKSAPAGGAGKEPRNCRVCGESFVQSRSTQVVCPKMACRKADLRRMQREYRQRKAAAAEGPQGPPPEPGE